MTNFLIQNQSFYTLDLDYIKLLYQHDHEVFFDSSSTNYNSKPYLGILATSDGYDYFIPLTSAKPKHQKWKNVTSHRYTQKTSGIINPYHCNFSLLESICDNYNNITQKTINL